MEQKEDGGLDLLTNSGAGFHLVNRLLRYGPNGMARAVPRPTAADIAAKGRGLPADVPGGKAISPAQSRIVSLTDAIARGVGVSDKTRGNMDASAGSLAVALRNLFE
jgi:hypothetical protein